MEFCRKVRSFFSSQCTNLLSFKTAQQFQDLGRILIHWWFSNPTSFNAFPGFINTSLHPPIGVGKELFERIYEIGIAFEKCRDLMKHLVQRCAHQRIVNCKSIDNADLLVGKLPLFVFL